MTLRRVCGLPRGRNALRRPSVRATNVADECVWYACGYSPPSYQSVRGGRAAAAVKTSDSDEECARPLVTHGRTDCSDRLAAFAARQPLIFIQFSPLVARPHGPFLSVLLPTSLARSDRRASNHRHQSVTGGAQGGGGGDRFAATCIDSVGEATKI